MRSSLAYLDLASGRLLHRREPEPQWHQLSIRHIDVSPDDRVAIAMQFEGQPQLLPPLIAIQQEIGHSSADCAGRHSAPVEKLLRRRDVQCRR